MTRLYIYKADRAGGLEIYLPDQLTGLSRCPHCSTANPSMPREFTTERGRDSYSYNTKVFWATYCCSTCGLPVSALQTERKYSGGDDYRYTYEIFPSAWEPDDEIPAQPKSYLAQANATLSSPDASVVMSGAAVDAMLKVKGLTEGSLYSRIDKAVEDGLLTADIAAWAHQIRLNSNNPRHADESKPHMTPEDAKLSLDFAKAIGEILFILPSRMPSTED